MGSVAVVAREQNDTEEVRKAVSAALGRAVKKGYEDVLVVQEDLMACRLVELTLEMVGAGRMVVYHPHQKYPVHPDNVGRGDRWAFALERDEVPEYVSGTKPETMLSFTLEAMVADADAAIVVFGGGSAEHTAYPFNLIKSAGKPLYWIDSTLGNEGRGRWIMPGSTNMDGKSEEVIESWKDQNRKR